MSENSIGEIHIFITDNEIKYETEMSLPEVVFWVEAVKAMAMGHILTEDGKRIES